MVKEGLGDLRGGFGLGILTWGLEEGEEEEKFARG